LYNGLEQIILAKKTFVLFLKKLIGFIFYFTKSHKGDYAISNLQITKQPINRKEIYKLQRMTANAANAANANAANAANAATAEVFTVIADAVAMNHDLLSEIIFANDTAFADIDSRKAKMLLCASKMAQNNKNILTSIDSEKARKFCKEIKTLSFKKAKKTIYEWNKAYLEDEAGEADETGETGEAVLGNEEDLRIDEEYRTKVQYIIAKISKESEYVADTIKKVICAGQRLRVDKIIKSLNNSISILVNLGVDMENITDEDRYMCLDDYDYMKEKEDRVKIILTFKYNAYFLNTLFSNGASEDTIVEYINNKQRDDYYKKLSSVFTESL
jgi:hypothetical protein